MDLLAILGIIISVYAIIIRYSKKKQLCDINQKISCTKAIKGSRGTTLQIPNGFFGIIFYLLVMFLPQIYFLLTSIGLICTVVLFVRLRQLNIHCIVCYAAYVINILLFIQNFI